MSSANMSIFRVEDLNVDQRIRFLERSMQVGDPRAIWTYLANPNNRVSFGYLGETEVVFRVINSESMMCDYIRTPMEIWCWAVTNMHEPQLPEYSPVKVQPREDFDWSREGF